MDGKGGFGGEVGSGSGASGGGASGGVGMRMAEAEHRRVREQSCDHKANVNARASTKIDQTMLIFLTAKQLLQFSNTLLHN